MDTVEWISADSDTIVKILGPHDEANDYQTPAEGDETDTTTHGLAIHNGMNGICLMGSLEGIRDCLRHALDTVETALALEQTTGERGRVVSGDPESLECVCGNCASFEGLITATPEGIALPLNLVPTPAAVSDALAVWPEDQDELHTLCRVCGRLYRDATIRETNTAPVIRIVDLTDGTPARNAVIAHDAEMDAP